MFLSVAPNRLKELLNMVYHKGQPLDLHSSASILMIYLCIYHYILQNVICLRMICHMLADDTTLNRKKHCANFKKLQLCLDRISVWCNTNHMLINPVKTKVNDNYYTAKAPALRLVTEAVFGWSEY